MSPLLWLSSKVHEMIGRPAHAPKKLGWAEWTRMIHPDDRQDFIHAHDALLAGKAERLTLETRICHGNGGHVRLAFHGGVLERCADGIPEVIGGIVVDHGDPVALNRALARTETALQNLRDGIAFADPAGRLSYMNPAFRTMFGIGDSDDMSAIHWSQLYDQEVSAHIDTDIMPQLAEHRSWRGDLRGRRRDDGQSVVQEVTLSQDDDGTLICTARDITERLREQAERAQMRHQLVQLNRSEVMHILTAGVVHDLGNILGVIQHLSSLVEEEDTGQVNDIAAAISRSAQEAAALVQKRLSICNASVERDLFDLKEPVQRAVDVVRESLPATLELVLRLPERPMEAMVNDTEIVQVALNLLINASEAVDPEDGSITILLEDELVDHARDLDVGTLRAGVRYARLTAIDNGSGVSPAIRSRLFEPYVTTKSETGTGLGMFVVSEIAKSYGGGVAIAAGPDGRGARLDVYIALD